MDLSKEKIDVILRTVEVVEIKLPFWRYFEIFRARTYAYFLDSSLAAQTLGKFSFMGSDPHIIYRAYAAASGDIKDAGARVQLDYPSAQRQNKQYKTPDLFEDLRREMSQFQNGSEEYRDVVSSMPLPFGGGVVGYLGYEAGALIEHIPETPADDLGLPVACFLFVDYTFCFCHHTQTAYIAVTGRGEDTAGAQAHAEVLLQRVHDDILHFEDVVAERAVHTKAGLGSKPRSDFDKADGVALSFEAEHDRTSYCNAVRQIQSHIHEGRAYEVCLTHRYACAQEKDAWTLYQTLRDINPAPFASFLQFPEVQVVCSSPERFLHLDVNGNVESRPIKGTRPRGETTLHDLKLQDELRTSEKDRAENLMIVDLVRNDLSRVAKIGSVHVPQLLEVEQYATVLQLVSAIRAELRDDQDVFDLLRACFPGGSMTGAPKIEAMRIIASLEKYRRGIYSGAIGYIDYAGSMDMNIVIRSIVVHNKKCYFSVGGAIVSDSVPDAEYEETLDKARALVAALRA